MLLYFIQYLKTSLHFLEKKNQPTNPTTLPLHPREIKLNQKTPKPKSYQMCTEKLKTYYQNNSHNNSVSLIKLLYA